MKEWPVGLSVLLFTLLALAVGIFVLPGQEFEAPRNLLPWQIERLDGERVRVFGLVPGESAIVTAERRFGVDAEISLFASPEGRYAAEGYFDETGLAGLRAKVVLAADLDQATLAAMYGRGLRISKLGSGARRVTLAPDDLEQVRQAPIASITYLPRAKLDAELLEKRFGMPAEKVVESGEGVEHWLYPELGLDIAVSESGREVFQYVAPQAFDRLVRPLFESPTL